MNFKSLLVKSEAMLLLLLLLIIYFYYYDYSLWWFLIGLLIPDLSAIGFLTGEKAGNITYNAGHTIILPLILLVSGLLTGNDTFRMIGLIWLIHIYMDRMLGFDLRG